MNKRQYMIEWREKNRDHVREYALKYNSDNSEELRARAREYYRSHREELLLKSRKYKRDHGTNEERNEYGRAFRNGLRKEILHVLGDACVLCGNSDARVLHIDHVDGGGVRHRKEFGSRYQYYRSIINNGSSGLQLLCANCNFKKKREEDRAYGRSHRKESDDPALNALRERKRNCVNAINRKLREAALGAIGSKCCRCGESDIDVLQIDHVNGGGRREVISLGSQSLLYKKVIKDCGSGYQCLCANCNWIKKLENDEVYRDGDRDKKARQSAG